MISIGSNVLFRRMSGILGTAAKKSQSQDSNTIFLPVISGLVGIYYLTQTANASDAIHPAQHSWAFDGAFGTGDAASVRRGFEVYRQVCYTCHSIKSLKYRHLVGVIYTEEQAKALAASVKVKDGPNDKGEYFERPGRLTDPLPRPYENEQQARDANGGALPPDLSLIAKARHGGGDYVFSILTGYRDPPVGVELRQGLHYNPYFPGGSISMRPALQDGGAEFEDGTAATISQQAKDVVNFLQIAGEPKHEPRKKMGTLLLASLLLMACGAGYQKRFVWAIPKTRKITWQ